MTTRNSSVQSAGVADAYCSVMFEIRHDEAGEYYHLITAWKAARKKRNKAMPKTLKITLSANEITQRVSRGEDVSAYFTNKFTVVKPSPSSQCRSDARHVTQTR